MSKVKVQCKGSGQAALAGLNTKRAQCGHCSTLQDVRGDGKFRRHDRLTTTAKLRKGL